MAVNAEQNQLNQQNQNNSQQTMQGPTSGGGITTPVGSTGRVANYSSGNQQSPGSGRFTNLNKYLNANQGASERLASGISSNLDKQTASEKRNVNSQAADVRAGIESAQNKVNQGQQYLNQDLSANAQNIANNANQLQDFTNYRTNQAVDANALNNQANTAQTAATNLQNIQQQQLQNAGTEQGRFQLLKNAFGGGTVYQNPYSTGQQKLDQLFLQAGGTNNINNIQNQVKGQLAQTNDTLSGLGQNVTDIGTIGTNAQNLATQLQDKTNQLTNDYVSGVEGTAADVNAQRLADQKWAQDQYAKLQSGQAIDQKFADMMGLSQGQGLYNSLTGKNVNDFINFGATNLNGFGQLANQAQENQYSALAKLAGINPAYTLDGDPAAAIGNNNTLGGILGNAQTGYDQAVAGKNATANWGGGAIKDYSGNIGVNQAGNLLSGLSAAGIQALRGMNTVNANNVSDPYAGLSAQDAQILRNAANNVGITSSWGGNAGADYNSIAARLGALQNAANSLYDQGYWNRVNIAPPDDVESGGHFGVS